MTAPIIELLAKHMLQQEYDYEATTEDLQTFLVNQSQHFNDVEINQMLTVSKILARARQRANRDLLKIDIENLISLGVAQNIATTAVLIMFGGIPLSVTPSVIDFGYVELGETCSVNIYIKSEAGSIIIHNDSLLVSQKTFASGEKEISVKYSPSGSIGEYRTNIEIQTEYQEQISISVKAIVEEPRPLLRYRPIIFFGWINLGKQPNIKKTKVLKLVNDGREPLLGELISSNPWLSLSNSKLAISGYQNQEINVNLHSNSPIISFPVIKIESNAGNYSIPVFYFRDVFPGATLLLSLLLFLFVFTENIFKQIIASLFNVIGSSAQERFMFYVENQPVLWMASHPLECALIVFCVFLVISIVFLILNIRSTISYSVKFPILLSVLVLLFELILFGLFSFELVTNRRINLILPWNWGSSAITFTVLYTVLLFILRVLKLRLQKTALSKQILNVLPILSFCIFISGFVHMFDSINQKYEIDARDGWMNSGISVKSGEILYVDQVFGSWTVSKIGNQTAPFIDMSGYVYGIPYDSSFSYAPTHPLGSMIFKVGLNETLYGADKSLYLEAVNDGFLYFRINESDWNRSDNQGKITIQISSEREDLFTQFTPENISKLLNDIMILFQGSSISDIITTTYAPAAEVITDSNGMRMFLRNYSDTSPLSVCYDSGDSGWGAPDFGCSYSKDNDRAGWRNVYFEFVFENGDQEVQYASSLSNNWGRIDGKVYDSGGYERPINFTYYYLILIPGTRTHLVGNAQVPSAYDAVGGEISIGNDIFAFQLDESKPTLGFPFPEGKELNLAPIEGQSLEVPNNFKISFHKIFWDEEYPEILKADVTLENLSGEDIRWGTIGDQVWVAGVDNYGNNTIETDVRFSDLDTQPLAPGQKIKTTMHLLWFNFHKEDFDKAYI